MNNNLSEEAITFIKQNTKLLINTYAPSDLYSSVNQADTFFMAGSPGAGKTEFSIQFLKAVEESVGRRYVRIDADDIRALLPQYNGANSDIVQGAAALGVQKLLDYVLHNNIDFLLDGTLSKYAIAKNNIERALKHKRKVGIFYLYQDPVIAWEFTKRREALEGRTIPKAAFIEGFCNSIVTVNKLKKHFNKTVQLDVIIKDYQNKVSKWHSDVDKVDSFIENEYNAESLTNLLL